MSPNSNTHPQVTLIPTECLSLALPTQGECTDSRQGTLTLLPLCHQESRTFLLHDLRRFRHQSGGWRECRDPARQHACTQRR